MKCILSLLLLLSCLAAVCVTGFIPTTTTSSRRTQIPLQAAGMGMAVAPSTKRSKKNGKKSKSKPKTSTPFNANASLLRLEKKYDELSKQNAKAIQDDVDSIVTSEYVIAARSVDTTFMADWVPVAQMCLARPLQDAETSDGIQDESVLAAVSYYCREIYEAATLGSPLLKSCSRNTLQYSVEPLDSFHKYVYETVVDDTNANKNEHEIMTKSQAKSVLKLKDDESDPAVIKKAYRTMSFEFHPDRLVGESDDKVQSASQEYARVKLAYDALTSGVRTSASWYESLGGRARTDFRGPLTLLSLNDAKTFLSSQPELNSAVVGLDPEMVQTFVVRNQAAIR